MGRRPVPATGQPATPLAHRRARAVTAVLAIAALTGGLLSSGRLTPAAAASPSSGTIGPGNPSRTWDGRDYPLQSTLVPEACPPASDPDNLRCDHFYLTVNVAASYWNTRTGGARIRIAWADPNDDFDLYVYDKNGNQVAASAAGGTTSEEVIVQDANSGQSPYEVRVVPFLVECAVTPCADPQTPGDQDYDGRATFETATGGDPPNPTRETGGLAFGPATVVDPQRTEGEPLNWIDRNGNYWETGPYGASTQQSFIHRSIDGGDQFNIVSPVGLRPDPPPGGGDTDLVTDDQRIAYFVDLEALVNLGCAVSNDDGNSWRKNPVCVDNTVVDRQWFAIDNGTNRNAGTPSQPNQDGAADNTVFLAFRQVTEGSFIYSSPGSKGPADPTGGLVYANSSADSEPISNGAPCGQLRFDPVKRNLYYPCVAGDHVEITVGHVDVGQRTGIEYVNRVTPRSPGGAVGDIFPSVATDSDGTLYAVWVDENDHNVYYSASFDEGVTWTDANPSDGPASNDNPEPDVWQVNGNDANSNVFPWAQAGSPGNLAVAWYGSPSELDSDDMPSWYEDREAADDFEWFGYASLIRNAASSSPSFAQQRFTAKPMHYGQICNSGLACTTEDGDRTLLDFFAVHLDRDGTMRFVYNDTTSQHHGAHVFEVRQLAGPTANGGSVNKARPGNPMADRAADANWPHYAPGGPGAGGRAGPNQPHLDLRRLNVSQPNASMLRVELSLENLLVAFNPPAGKANNVWLVRFQARSRGEGGEEAYRIFYVGAESVGTNRSPIFFAGSGEAAAPAPEGAEPPGNGCQTTTPENCKLVNYPKEVLATGQMYPGTGRIVIDVPIQGGFDPALSPTLERPILGDVLHNVTAFTFGRNADADVYADVDATRPFNYRLGSRVIPPSDPVVTLVKSGPLTAKRGQLITYELEYRNAGPAAAEQSVITDSLPLDVAFVSASNGGTYSSATHSVTWKIGTVGVNAGATRTVTGRVRQSALVGMAIVNRATFTAAETVSPPTGITTTLIIP